MRDTRTMADPMPLALGLFGFALAMFAVRFIGVDATTLAVGSTTVALNYALLIGGIAELLGGVLGIIRGMRYPAYVTAIFGTWLIGFYYLVTAGETNKAFTPNAVAWWSLVLIVPVAIMAVPAFIQRNIPFAAAFIALIALLLFSGLGFHNIYTSVTAAEASKSAPDLSTAVNLVKTAAWFAVAAALAIWYMFAVDVYRLTGVLKSNEPTEPDASASGGEFASAGPVEPPTPRRAARART
jgi:succinate-acetate transporter protein